jgi:vacuolar-type H+-ATPase subunit E/Vma4
MNENELNYSVNEKLKSFTDMALREAHKRKKELIEHTRKRTEEQFRQKEIELLENAYHSIQTGTRQNRRELNEEVSRALVEGKKKLFDKRKRIIGDVFKTAEQKLEEYRKSEDYGKDMLGQMKKCIEILDDEKYLLEADPDEIKTMSEIAGKAGIVCETRPSENELGGGFILYAANKNMRIDCSFTTRKKEAREKFLEICKIPIEDGDLLDERG